MADWLADAGPLAEAAVALWHCGICGALGRPCGQAAWRPFPLGSSRRDARLENFSQGIGS